MKPKTKLNPEQFTWLMTLTKDEKEKILRLLQTGDWLLVWQESTHAYALHRNEAKHQEDQRADRRLTIIKRHQRGFRISRNPLDKPGIKAFRIVSGFIIFCTTEDSLFSSHPTAICIPEASDQKQRCFQAPPPSSDMPHTIPQSDDRFLRHC